MTATQVYLGAKHFIFGVHRYARSKLTETRHLAVIARGRTWDVAYPIFPKGGLLRDLKSIQCLRGIAALLVVYTHLTSIQGNYSHLGWSFPYRNAGALGVDLFFVLSGFIIALILDRRETSLREFAARRFFRIFPIYWAFTALALIAAWVQPAWTMGGPSPSLVDIISSIFVLPQDRYPVLFVGWSLEHEIFFYAIVGLLLLAHQIRYAPAILVGLAMIGLLPGLPHNAWTSHLFSKYNLLFAMGMVVFRTENQLRGLGTAVPVLLASVALTLLIGSGLPLGEHANPTLIRVAALAVAGPLLLIGLLNLEERRGFESRGLRTVVWAMILVGDASYVLYLSHPFTLSLIGNKVGVAMGVSGTFVGPWLAISTIATVAVAAAIHIGFEVPFLKFTHRFFRASGQQVGRGSISREIPQV